MMTTVRVPAIGSMANFTTLRVIFLKVQGVKRKAFLLNNILLPVCYPYLNISQPSPAVAELFVYGMMGKFA
jgi:hypothetical protein